MVKSLIKHIKRFVSSELFKNISVLVSGTVLAQIIAILAQPILRRFYTPETYGAYAIYVSILSFLLVTSSFKYELAIIHPKKDKESLNILVLGTVLSFLFNISLLIIIIFFNEEFAIFLNLSEKYSHFLYFVPLGAFMFNFYQNLDYWLIRKKRFKASSVNKLIRRSTESSFQIGFKWLKIPSGLIYGDLLGHLGNIVSGLYQSIKNGFSLKKVSLIKIIYVAKKYSEYPKFNLVPGMMSVGSSMIPLVLINKYFKSEFTGYFDLSKLVLSIPLSFIAISISNVLMQRVSEKIKEKKSILVDLIPVFCILLAISIIEILVIIFYGEELFVLFFGKEWAISGKLSKIMVWSYAINFIVSSFISIFVSMKKIKLFSIWQILVFFSISILVFLKEYQFMDFLKSYVILEINYYIILFILMVFIIIKYERSLKIPTK